MGIRNLLYVSDLKDRDISLRILQRLLPVQDEGIGNIIFLVPLSSANRAEDIASIVKNPVKVKSVKDISLSSVLKAAKEEDVSLIVIDLDRERCLHVTKRIVKSSAVPVLVMNDKDIEKGLFDHVIFATNWALPVQDALEYFLDIKSLIKELEIVHVIHEKLTVKDLRELKAKMMQTRTRYLDEGIDAESHVYAGNTAEEIAAASRDYKGTIIIVGRHLKDSMFKRLFKESTAYEIIKKQEVPVLFFPLNKGKE